MDIPLPPLTTTISSGASLILTERSTETEARNPLVWVVVLSVLISSVISAGVTWTVMCRLDGQRWIGWTGQMVSLNGKDRRVLIPIFMTPGDLKDLQEGRK